MQILPRISIIMPSFNQAKFIEESIKSVINQDYPNKEFLIIDGGSTDGTLEIIEKYKDKIDFFISEKDYSQNHAVNKGILFSTGEIIGWLNSDDTYEKGSLSKIADYFVKNPNIEIVYGLAGRVDINDEIKGYFGNYEHDLKVFLNERNYFPCQATFFKKKCLAFTGLLDINLRWNGDWDLWRKIALNFNVGHINEHIGNWRIHNESISYQPGVVTPRAIETIKSAYKYNRNIFSKIIVGNIIGLMYYLIPYKNQLRKIKRILKKK